MLCGLVLSVCIAVADAVKLRPPQQVDSDIHLNCDTDHVLMYTLPKTGSTSLQQSIRDYCKWPAADFPYLETFQDEYPRSMKVHRNHAVAKDYLSKLPPSSTVWIITMVRNPFERFISSYFQSHWCEYVNRNGTLAEGLTASKERATRSLHAMLDGCSGRYFDGWVNATGIPIGGGEFNQTKKHIFKRSVQNSKTLNAILLRAEDIDQWDSILAPYMPGLTMETVNEADEKIYADFYHQIKQSFVFSDEEKTFIAKNSDVFQFYTPEEKAAMISSLPEGKAASLLRVEARRASAACYCTCR